MIAELRIENEPSVVQKRQVSTELHQRLTAIRAEIPQIEEAISAAEVQADEAEVKALIGEVSEKSLQAGRDKLSQLRKQRDGLIEQADRLQRAYLLAADLTRGAEVAAMRAITPQIEAALDEAIAKFYEKLSDARAAFEHVMEIEDVTNAVVRQLRHGTDESPSALSVILSAWRRQWSKWRHPRREQAVVEHFRGDLQWRRSHYKEGFRW